MFRSRYKFVVVQNAYNKKMQKELGWTFAIQTHRVLQAHNAHNAKMQILKGGRSRYKLVVSLKFTTPANTHFTVCLPSRYEVVVSV